jgi:hypothetical protein
MDTYFSPAPEGSSQEDNEAKVHFSYEKSIQLEHQ